MKVTMPVWKLVDIYQGKHPGGHFFDRDTLKFFGERLSDMRVLSETETIKDCSGEKHECYVLSRLQRKHPAGPRRTYAYFDVETLDHIAGYKKRGLQWHDPKAEQEYRMRVNGCEKKKLGTKECWFKGDEFVEEVLRCQH